MHQGVLRANTTLERQTSTQTFTLRIRFQFCTPRPHFSSSPALLTWLCPKQQLPSGLCGAAKGPETHQLRWPKQGFRETYPILLRPGVHHSAPPRVSAAAPIRGLAVPVPPRHHRARSEPNGSQRAGRGAEAIPAVSSPTPQPIATWIIDWSVHPATKPALTGPVVHAPVAGDVHLVRLDLAAWSCMTNRGMWHIYVRARIQWKTRVPRGGVAKS